MPKLKPLPEFKAPREESDFWSKHDSTQYLDWTKARLTFYPKLKPSVQTISIRLPKSIIESLKVLANKKDVPYQSLMKIYLGDRIAEEFKGSTK